MTWESWIESQLDDIRAAGQWRRTRSFDAHGPEGRLEGEDVVSFASNDYLGLATHPSVVAAASAAAERWGTGSTASRLIVGTRPGHCELEEEIADWKATPAAVVFSSGYSANLGVLGALGGPHVTVCSDELNHASIIDGCRLSRSAVAVYRHGDVDHLEKLLVAAPGRRVVVTDTVFSMDGDVAPLPALREVCARHDALLVIDEAHAVLGPDLPDDGDGPVTVRVGTLSKALGSVGGWVASSTPMIDLLVNRARSFIFTTALTPPDTAAALAALRIVRSAEGDALVARLREVTDRVRDGHPSPIVPILLGDEDRAVEAADALLELGLLVPAIRPPTVPPGTSRLRIAMSAAHSDDMVERLLDGLGRIGVR
ncbi:MAG TPA: 8-amino-7-oxononanoate synthase [Acidimicrobiales bacterium]|nr:8-amino-7-oxononanoate synthase [Acidimicrobiales bacterium]